MDMPAPEDHATPAPVVPNIQVLVVAPMLALEGLGMLDLAARNIQGQAVAAVFHPFVVDRSNKSAMVSRQMQFSAVSA
jgi:hypothetical protein